MAQRCLPLAQASERRQSWAARAVQACAKLLRGAVLVGGRVVTNPSSHVLEGSALVIWQPKPLRGEAKLRAALASFEEDPFGVPV
jgi:predicted rRNA methylase YqxC with S4 and FtsJ domains